VNFVEIGPVAAAGPETAVPGNGNDGSRLMPTSLVMGVLAAAVAIHALF